MNSQLKNRFNTLVLDNSDFQDKNLTQFWYGKIN